MQFTTIGIKSAMISSRAVLTFGAGASYSVGTDFVITGWAGDNVAGNVSAMGILDDLTTWVEFDDINGVALLVGADQPVSPPCLLAYGNRLTSSAGATKIVIIYKMSVG